MTRSNSSEARPRPWHLWTVGLLALAWNGLAAVDVVMTQLGSDAWLAAMTPEQLAYLAGFPRWAVIAWALGGWGGVVGAVLLLARSRLALEAFVASLVGALGTTLYTYGLSDGLAAMGGGASVALSVVIVTVAVGLVVYAHRQVRAGVLQ